MKLKHEATGWVASREEWVASYDADELEERGLTAEEAFAEDEWSFIEVDEVQ